MSTYVLDTDTTTLLFRGHHEVCGRAARFADEELSVTIVTVEEMLTGWYTQIRRAKKDEQLLHAYSALQNAVELLGRMRILPMDAQALEQFHKYRKSKYHIGTNDLRIAAIAKHHEVTLVTRNLRDFRRLPGLMIEDWS